MIARIIRELPGWQESEDEAGVESFLIKAEADTVPSDVMLPIALMLACAFSPFVQPLFRHP